jgi:hypothetical protein
MLAPGFYSFRFTAEGYFPQTINNVAVNNFQTTILNAELIPNPVPVELISFSAEVAGNSVELKWQTATETNNSGFEILRKKSEVRSQEAEWEIIAFVPGFGTTTEPKAYSFIDDLSITPNLTLRYRLKQIDFNGSYTYSNILEVEIAAPNVFSLEQNYPNPFNPSTKIKFTIPSVIASETKQSQLVTLKVYDILGNEIATLVNEEKSAGSYEVEFNASNLPSGIYFYQLKAGQYSETKKMILLK